MYAYLIPGRNMKHLPTLELLRRTVRSVACTQCHSGARFGNGFSAAMPRPCEVECTIFANLPKLAKLAHDDAGNRLGHVERQMHEQICLNCHAHISVGSECGRRQSRECPLSVHLLQIVEPLARVLASRSRRYPKAPADR